MKKTSNLILVGICLMLAGLIIIISENIGVSKAKLIVPLLFLVSGIYTIKHSRANKNIEIAAKFEFLKGIGLVTFALLVYLFSGSLLTFLKYVTYFILMYGLLEIMFPFAVLNSKNKVVGKMLIYRMVAGITASIGALILLFAINSSEYEGLMTAGVLTILIGFSNIIYSIKIQKLS